MTLPPHVPAYDGPATEFPASDDYKRSEHVARALGEIDLDDASTILCFGSRAQEQLMTISENMLDGVRTKDSGTAGAALNDMVATLRGFDIGALDPTRERRLLDRLFGAAGPLTKVLQRYEEVRRQVDSICDRLDAQKTLLMGDILTLDRLYDASLAYFHNLADYIAAGEQKLREVDERLIPSRRQDADGSDDVLKAQRLRDLLGVRDDLDRRVHDLKLTRQVAMQALPSIRLVQQNDKSLVAKITSVIANTVPLWRTQLAQAVTIHRSREAGRSLKEANDLTNELLLANAENLKQANAEVRREVGRGVFDIEAVRRANDLLVATIEEGMQIAADGRRQRADAEQELRTCESQLREALATMRASASTTSERR
ncbi:MAG: toxic anion resistance protein [Rhodospirillales bacterium]|nr:toxic anion resistance protein [Rhodospirillales bacterium]